MRVLVLGGTRFVGRTLVEQALAVGHQVTTINRGLTGHDVPGAEVLRADRENETELHTVTAGREWDWVIDTSGYVPKVVGNSARLLSGKANAYVFLSTVSVYPSWPAEPVSEDSAIYDCSPDMPGTAADEAHWTAAQYGTYKAGCERAVLEAFNGHVTILRPGVILGPQENVGRLTWWLKRIKRGGKVLAPGDPAKSIQPIDVRDLAAFTLACLETETKGTFNVTAPEGHTTFGQMLAACLTVTSSDAELVWIDADFLVSHNVRQWTELPLWRTALGTWSVDTTRTLAAGLTSRPTRETVQDTYQWLSKSGNTVAHERQSHHGISPDREKELIKEWQHNSQRH
ncbi:NAD-dependent epimerase/dehydratase family protein [Sphaerisporangium sp. NPDC049003]|uniref:NAD-dependent epimerase/dehydratase family protein n=1 Tax=Sphaerisporangium sp. NPDC049003 TaxID=3364517 RepID=UPI00371BCF0B